MQLSFLVHDMASLDILHQIYDGQKFKKRGSYILDLLSEYLEDNTSGNKETTIPYQDPKEMLSFWEDYEYQGYEKLIKDFYDRSIHIHNKRYMGHQVVPPAPDTALTSLLGSLLNNGGAVYEMGMASNALEKVVTNWMLPYFGYGPEGGGVMTSGGTLANLTALLSARSDKGDSVWIEGTKEQYAFMVSEEAHYCIDRAVKIMGWGEQGMIKVPVDKRFVMKTDELQHLYDDALEKGIKVIGIVGSAPTTSTGNYDDLKAIGQFAIRHNLWYHIDGAHGGPVVFSDEYKHLMNGCELADSITVDGHKMMMMPGVTTSLLFKQGKKSYKTFSQEAQYLWTSNDDDWHNPGKRTFECTKLIMSLRYYTMIQEYGDRGFKAFVDQCYENGNRFAQLVTSIDGMELGVAPDSNIVCFRPRHCKTLAQINQIRKRILDDGRFYIVQTVLKGEPYLRVTLMNPFTSEDDMKELLFLIKSYA